MDCEARRRFMLALFVWQVGIVGLGVSALPLLKLLLESQTDFRVVTKDAFGIWQKLNEAKENFDLVTTIESTNFSWWEP